MVYMKKSTLLNLDPATKRKPYRCGAFCILMMSTETVMRQLKQLLSSTPKT